MFNPSLQTLALVKESRLNTTFYILNSLGESHEDELLLESVLGPVSCYGYNIASSSEEYKHGKK